MVSFVLRLTVFLTIQMKAEISTMKSYLRLFPDKQWSYFQNFFTNVNETHHIPECAAERLTADVFCDHNERDQYKKYQHRIYRKWFLGKKWNEAKAIYQNGVETLKYMISYDSKETPTESVKQPVKEKEVPPYIKKARLEEIRRLEILNSRSDNKD